MKYSLEDITKLYRETFHVEEPTAIALIAAILVNSRLKTPPIWLYLIGPSSGGKSALIEAFGKVPFATQVSDLTPNTFLSGFSNKRQETSLLKRLGTNFTILMKDFTTILNKPEESQAAIIAQMREIYDGHFTKETGTGVTLEWGSKETSKKGKATFIMACTEEIYTMQDKFASMGTRATNYVLPSENRRAATEKSLRANSTLDEKMDIIQTVFRDFVMERLANIPPKLPYVEHDFEQEIIDVADFSAMCRSVVKRDYRGVKSLALSAEMPMRIAKQLLGEAQALTYINDGKLEPFIKNAVFKMGIDSIPKQRRLIIEVLAKYNKVSKSGLADLIHYPPDRCGEWLDDLLMFRLIERVRGSRLQHWRLRPDVKPIVLKYFNITPVDKDLEGEEDLDDMGGNYNDIDKSYEAVEMVAVHDEHQEEIFNEI